MHMLSRELHGLESPFVVMGVGIPGSGKTTVLSRVAHETDVKLVSTDGIREELTGDASDQSVTPQVWEEVNKRLTEELRAGRSVILDATNTEAWRRPQFIHSVRAVGAFTVVAAEFVISLDLAKERNARRERVVPEFVIDIMHAALQAEPPRISEGFDQVIRIPS